MNLEITSARPLPAHGHRAEKHTEFRLSLQRLGVGESVFYAGMTPITGQSYCSKQGAYSGKRFTTSVEGDGIRCWRTQ